jgi:hypothetical protein
VDATKLYTARRVGSARAESATRSASVEDGVPPPGVVIAFTVTRESSKINICLT